MLTGLWDAQKSFQTKLTEMRDTSTWRLLATRYGFPGMYIGIPIFEVLSKVIKRRDEVHKIVKTVLNWEREVCLVRFVNLLLLFFCFWRVVGGGGVGKTEDFYGNKRGFPF